MSALTEAEMHSIADRLLGAITAAHADAVREVYAPDASIWHNFDEVDQTVDQNLATLVDLHQRASGLQYTEIRRFLAPGGFVQQHVLVGQAAGGPLHLPAMIRFWVEGGRITRLEEYLDTRQALVLYTG
ncbi:MAG TPA: nuclear transport factor 2 family protein [Ilumatobacteraceae bacterium]|jgi:ketosteroid isomerase-like protein|nr:nuclear transport factor 2 family protein [Ilumatobacteraceae bacterium]HRA83437.1 nuclear transport factor 2 family protein [Ilumatobacteraceae bacterium]HRC46033.1 nuclear transport factor 2 family protein [Ilumatobacteraceae bacterium]